MDTNDICTWVHKFAPTYSEEECLDAYAEYRRYRDEGQSDLVSRQYAGLLRAGDIDEY